MLLDRMCVGHRQGTCASVAWACVVGAEGDVVKGGSGWQEEQDDQGEGVVVL